MEEIGKRVVCLGAGRAVHARLTTVAGRPAYNAAPDAKPEQEHEE